MNWKIATINHSFDKLFGLNISGNDIYIGNDTVNHIKTKHLNDYNKYFVHIEDILNTPDLIAINPKDNSLEFVKEYKIENEYVKVAVRVSGNGKYFVRSMYTLENSRVANFIAKGTLKKCT